jgi:hypothetical protein
MFFATATKWAPTTSTPPHITLVLPSLIIVCAGNTCRVSQQDHALTIRFSSLPCSVRHATRLAGRDRSHLSAHVSPRSHHARAPRDVPYLSMRPCAGDVTLVGPSPKRRATSGLFPSPPPPPPPKKTHIKAGRCLTRRSSFRRHAFLFDIRRGA